MSLIETPTTKARHPSYYLDATTDFVVLQVESTLYKVQRSYLLDSSVFSDMLSLPQPSTEEAEGMSDTKPIILPGVTSYEFDQLLWLMNARLIDQKQPFNRDRWVAILRLSHMWQFEGIFDHAMSVINREKLDPSDLLLLGLTCGVSQWWKAGYKSLIQDDELLSRETAATLGWDIAWKIASVREKWRATKQPTPVNRTVPGPTAFVPPAFNPPAFSSPSPFHGFTFGGQMASNQAPPPLTLDALIDASFDATGNPIWSEGRINK